MKPSDGIKMIFPVRRQTTISRTEFIASWFAHHMPYTIKAMGDRGWGYIGTVFNAADQVSDTAWDGIAQMFLNEPLHNPCGGFGMVPADSFHERAVEPYFGWPTKEFIILSGSNDLQVHPLTLDAPFPCSRSGFFKVVMFTPANPQVDPQLLETHWRQTRAPQMQGTMEATKGFRYVVSIGQNQTHRGHHREYAAMEELYFNDEADWHNFLRIVKPDPFLPSDIAYYFADTEFVAIPT